MNLLQTKNFKRTIHGKPVELYSLRNTNGCLAEFTNYGGRWLSMWVPDKEGRMADVVLGFDSIDGYLNADERYHGAVIGRVCGRIGKGRFTINSEVFNLDHNDVFGEPVKNHLHGGYEGFSFQVWEGKKGVNQKQEEFLELSYFSVDGEAGYPGNMHVKVIYTLTKDNSIHIDYSASTDKVSVVNLSFHPYFNLSGNADHDVLDHLLRIEADYSLDTDESLLPTGKRLAVAGSPSDFTFPKSIHTHLNEEFPGQLYTGKGYVVSYVLKDGDFLIKPAASIEDRESGRCMELYTDQPGLQFYHAWLFNGSDIGKNGQPYNESAGIALEPQGYPDAPNQPGFPSILLNAGDVYQHQTVYRFLVKAN